MKTLADLLPSDTERWRYQNLVRNLTAWRALLQGHRVLDFGASWGTSAIALIEAGAGEVVAVEPDGARVERGRTLIAEALPGARISLLHVPNTEALPFGDGEFPFVLTNGVLEHIPQPRDRYVRELWRLVSPGGHLMVTETPNTYWPKDTHTTGLWFNHWLPRGLAHRRAVRRGRFRAERNDWATSGWRGMGYHELVRPIRGYRLIPDSTRVRHRILAAIGLPASLIDPDPIWILRKESPLAS
jgi:ubiquinone/menaquinone biosynthesis C-methylase UbiE